MEVGNKTDEYESKNDENKEEHILREEIR